MSMGFGTPLLKVADIEPAQYWQILKLHKITRASTVWLIAYSRHVPTEGLLMPTFLPSTIAIAMVTACHQAIAIVRPVETRLWL